MSGASAADDILERVVSLVERIDNEGGDDEAAFRALSRDEFVAYIAGGFAASWGRQGWSAMALAAGLCVGFLAARSL